MFEIKVPNENDSVCKITLDNKIYHLRFTWNDSEKIWSFGIYNDAMDPLIPMTRIVRDTPLLYYYTYTTLPTGDFFAVSLQKTDIGREDFETGNAGFYYATKEEWGF